MLWLAFAVLALTTLVLHREVLFAGEVYHMDDAADGYYPCHVAIARAYRQGSLPAWEPDAAAGWPMVADPYYGPFYPLGAIFGIVGAARGLGVEIALHTILCAAGMLLLLRRRGCSPFASAFGAASLALSSFLVCRIRHIIFPEGLAWFTFALAFCEGYLSTRRWRELALVGLSVGMTLLCGALPLLPFFAMVGVAYVLPRVLAATRAWNAAAAIFGAALLGLALAAAQLVPTLCHLPLSPRALGTSYEFASSYAWPKLDYLATLVVPDLFGVEDRARWYGAFNHWEMAAYYTGLWALCFSLFAAFSARAGRRLGVALLWAAALVGIALAFGDAGPLHGWFYRHVPLYAALRCPTRALVMSMFAFSVLGADGLDLLIARVTPRRRWPLVLGVAAATLAVVAAVVLVKTHFLFKVPKGAVPGGVTEARLAFAHFAWVLGAGVALLGLHASGRARSAIAPAFFALALLDLYSLDRGYLQPKPFDYVDGSQRFQAVDWLLAQKPTDRFALDPHGPFRLHNLGMTYAIPSATAYSSVQIFRYVNFLEVLASGRGLPRPLRSDPAASDVRRFDGPLVSLLNVRWVISDHLPAAGWILRFHPTVKQHTPASYWEPSWDQRLSVWENPRVMPRAFVVHGAQVVHGDDAALTALAKLDPRKTALLEVTPSVSLPPRSDAPIEPARIVEDWRGRLRISADASAPGILVVADADYPGWEARVDGAAQPLLRADYALRGVALPAGHHEVELRYRPRAVYGGLAVSLLAMLALIGLAAIGRAREARSGVLP